MKHVIAMSLVLLLLPAAAWAQGLQNIPIYGEVAYVPGASYGPFYVEPQPIDTDFVRYAQAYWADRDNGTATVNDFTYITEGATDGPYEPDINAGVFNTYTFQHLYAHRLQPQDPAGYANMSLLLEADSTVATIWKHWTLYHQILTSATLDPVAHQKHLDLAVDALFGSHKNPIRGVPYYDGTTLVTDRLYYYFPLPVAAQGQGPQGVYFPQDQLEAVTQCVKDHADVLSAAKYPSLYKQDTAGDANSPPKSGFDCDDYVDAVGSHIVKKCKLKLPDHHVIEYGHIPYRWFSIATGPGAHDLLLIQIKNWASGTLVTEWRILIDPRTGASSVQPTPGLLSGDGIMGKTGWTDLSPLPPDSRDFARDGVPSSEEPAPWHMDPLAMLHFVMSTVSPGHPEGLDPADFGAPPQP